MVTVDELFTEIKYDNEELAIDIIDQLYDDDLIRKDEDGNTPLHLAACHGQNDVVETLVDRFSYEQLIIKDEDGHTPLHLAACHGHNDVVKTLVDKLSYKYIHIENAKLLIKDDFGWNKLHKAIMDCDNYEAIRIIDILTDEQLVIKDQWGNTPLHDVVDGGFYEGIMILLKKLKPEDRFITNKRGKTPLDIARTNKIKSLLQPMVKGANC